MCGSYFLDIGAYSETLLHHATLTLTRSGYN